MVSLGELVEPGLVVVRAASTTDGDIIRSLAGLLETRGYVTAAYADACIRRESTDPTGLPTGGAAVAIPHADPDHVVRAAIAIAVPERPIPFAQMGDPDTQVDAEAVFLLALTGAQEQLSALRSVAALVQDPDRLRALVGANTASEVLAVIAQHDQEDLE